MRVDKETYGRWARYVRLILRDYKISAEDVKAPVQAWNIAHTLNIPREAYHIGLNDSHIETALKRLFPLAWCNK
jgi:hypothetical protein